MFWTAPDMASYTARVPLGDAVLAERVIGEYPVNLATIRQAGVEVSDAPTAEIMGFGLGYSFDVKGYLRHLEGVLRAAGGEVHTGVRVIGVSASPTRRFRVTTERDGVMDVIDTDSLVLATGGFQASAALRARHMPEVGDDILLRSNTGSTGDGLTTAEGLGAGTAGDLGTFYGHLISHPVSAFTPDRYMLFSQYYSNLGILVTPDGHRFTDESAGDEIVNQDLAAVDGMRAFLIFDHGVRTTSAVSEPFANFGRIDRFDHAVEHGARHTVADTLPELVASLGGLGVDAKQLSRTLSGDTTVSPLAHRASRASSPTNGQLRTLKSGPFYALEVQPAITFTLGGIAIDARTRVLDRGGAPIDGLFAAGADIGGLSHYGYVGGLAPAHITGTIAGEEAAAC